MELLGEIKETPEPLSRSSCDDQNEADHYSRLGLQSIQNEFNYLSEKHKTTQAKIQSLTMHLEEFSQSLDKSKSLTLQSLVDELKLIYKESRYSRTSSFNIEGSQNTKFNPQTQRKLLFDDVALESEANEANEDFESVEKLKEQNIEANKEIFELKKRISEAEEKLCSFRIGSLEQPRYIEEVFRFENARLKERISDLEKKLEALIKRESMINEYYNSQIPNFLSYYRRLYEAFLKKLNYLKDKESRIFEVYKSLNKEYDESSGSKWMNANITFFVLIAAFIMGIIVVREINKVQYH